MQRSIILAMDPNNNWRLSRQMTILHDKRCEIFFYTKDKPHIKIYFSHLQVKLGENLILGLLQLGYVRTRQLGLLSLG